MAKESLSLFKLMFYFGYGKKEDPIITVTYPKHICPV